jgi:prolipoprotein diacylglyceryltransferase
VTLTTAVVRLSFDPFLRIGALAIPWRALAVAGAVLLALSLAVFLARRRGLRPDDLLFTTLGAVAGAVVGGRALHALAFLNVYQADPGALFDPARGSLSLLGAVVGGILTGAFIAGRLEGTLGQWADLAAAPVLLAIGLGKLAQLLAGAGQGTPFDGDWAIAFTGPGPWVSVSPSTPAHPAQLYEGAWALAGVPVVLVLLRRSRAEGRLLMLALAWWLLGRVAAGFTWRDERLLGPMGIEQVLAVLLFVFSVAMVASAVSARRRSRPAPQVAAVSPLLPQAAPEPHPPPDAPVPAQAPRPAPDAPVPAQAPRPAPDAPVPAQAPDAPVFGEAPRPAPEVPAQAPRPAPEAASPPWSPGPSSTAGHDGGIVDPAGGPHAVGPREVSDDATG